MAVRFVIDSASDFVYSEAVEQGLVFIPLLVSFGDESYRDGIDLTPRQFFEKLIETDELPKTSQVNPSDFLEGLGGLIDNGDDAVIVTLSSKLSGTYQSALVAAADFPGRVFVVDSENACIGQQVLIRRGLQLAAEGLEAREIAETLDAEKKKIRLLAMLNTLEYLKKGGRVSAAAAFAGGILSIKPVIAIEDGAVAVLGKARGSKQANNLLKELVRKTNGIDFTKPVMLGYSGTDDSLLNKYIADSRELWAHEVDELPVCCIGSTIGTHAGPGAVAVTFFEK